MVSHFVKHTKQLAKFLILSLLGSGLLGACATTKSVQKNKDADAYPIDIAQAPLAKPEPLSAAKPVKPFVPPSPITDPHQNPPSETTPISPIPDGFENGFDDFNGWADFDARPAFIGFLGSCQKWAKRKPETKLHKSISEFGTIGDWRGVCHGAYQTHADYISVVNKNDPVAQKLLAKDFFETNFANYTMGGVKNSGMMTAYYAPQIEVRRKADTEFYEPILARPKTKADQNLPRSDIGVHTAKVLAYGRPIEVFFLQIQGSGRIKFENGQTYRAAFDGHNSKQYRSIGKALVERGEMKLSQASKASIENWMAKNGPIKAKALMDENPRYVFFKTEHLVRGDDGDILGPKGAMGVSLTAMGSVAIDPRYTAYGALIWVETKLPKMGGDYKGQVQGLLLNAQDTGGAIKGMSRGDIYFGAGDDAGLRAGVMKHNGDWHTLLPLAVAYRLSLMVS